MLSRAASCPTVKSSVCCQTCISRHSPTATSRKWRVTPNWQPWLVFFLRSLAEQTRHLNRKIEREKRVLAPLPELSLQIVEFAREHGRITMGGIIRLTGANRNTLKQHFRALVEQGHLNQHGSGRGVWYELL